MSREVEYPERPASEQLVDLHVYVVPPDLWRDHLNSAINQIINDTVSAGFIRVLPESSIYTLREELEQQLGYDIIPREYVFLKSVGRCLTRIRPKQEFQLKIKNFLPPLAYVPEVFLLEASPEYLSSYPSSGAPSGRNSRLDTGPSDFNPLRTVPPIRSQQGSIRNGHGSIGSTAGGTQTAGPATNIGMKRDGRDTNKYNNNASDDSGISEMDEADRRRAEDRLQSTIRETSQEKSSTIYSRGGPPGSQPNGSRGGSRVGDVNNSSDKRQDLADLERRRKEVLEEEKRKQTEEEDRWKQWGEGADGQRANGQEDTIQEEEDPLDSLLTEPLDQNELKEKLEADLEDARHERKEIEKRREELVKRARALQNKTQQRRAHARDLWKKRYFEEKKKTAPLEDQANKLKQELGALHRKIMSQLEASKVKPGVSTGRKGEKPSPQSNLKIQATKLQHEIEELQRRVENVKMKLTSEMKLRNQAETELRALRAELTQKKINMSLSRTKLHSLQGDVGPGVPLSTR